MPRALRIHVPGAFYHITLRGNHRQSIFFAASDRRVLDDITAEVLDRFSARLHAYCWMTNHIHMLIQVGDVPLGRLMVRIAGRYARIVQKRLHTTGHLFEKRYHAILIDADEYLLQLVRYIHLNPVRAHLVGHPCDYPWSSHRVYVGVSHQPWVTTDFTLSMFHSNRGPAADAYARFVDGNLTNASGSPLADANPNDHRILGSDEFAAKLLGSAWQPKSRKTLHDLIFEACVKFAVTEDALQSSSSRRHLTEARAWVAQQAISLRITSLSAVARHFHRTEGALRHSVNRYFRRP